MWHKKSGNLLHSVETNHQYQEKWVQKINYHVTIGGSINRYSSAVLIFKEIWVNEMGRTEQSLEMGALASVRPRVGFLSPKYGDYAY